MKILVTGNAGFIGFHVAKRLLERGDDVTRWVVFFSLPDLLVGLRLSQALFFLSKSRWSIVSTISPVTSAYIKICTKYNDRWNEQRK